MTKLLPDHNGETFWMLLTLLTLPVKQQIELIGGLPKRGDPRSLDYSNNNASFLLGTLSEYYNGWWDEFEPSCPNAEKLMSFIENESFELSEESYENEENWRKLREFAALALRESGLDPWPISNQINFDDYIEIVRE